MESIFYKIYLANFLLTVSTFFHFVLPGIYRYSKTLGVISSSRKLEPRIPSYSDWNDHVCSSNWSSSAGQVCGFRLSLFLDCFKKSLSGGVRIQVSGDFWDWLCCNCEGCCQSFWERQSFAVDAKELGINGENCQIFCSFSAIKTDSYWISFGKSGHLFHFLCWLFFLSFLLRTICDCWLDHY